MKIYYSHIITYPDGKLFSVGADIFDSETKATDVIYDLFGSDYTIQWTGDHYKLYTRGSNRKHVLNAYIVGYNGIY